MLPKFMKADINYSPFGSSPLKWVLKVPVRFSCSSEQQTSYRTVVISTNSVPILFIHGKANSSVRSVYISNSDAVNGIDQVHVRFDGR